VTTSEPNLSPDPAEGNVRDVVACVVSDARGRLLVAKRPHGKRHAGLWEFPGGKVREGESLAEAAGRELEEELGVRLRAAAEAPEFVRRDPGSPFRILFLRVEIEGEPRALEHQDIAWFEVGAGWSPPFAPADADYVASLPA